MAHGGIRKGAGRKPVKNKSQSRVMRVPESIAPTIKRVIDALKDNPDLEKELLKVIYTQGHVIQLQHIKENSQVMNQPEQQRFERNGLFYVDNINNEIGDPDCDICLYYENCYEIFEFPANECKRSTDYFTLKQ